jgi:hypothetical protein
VGEVAPGSPSRNSPDAAETIAKLLAAATAAVTALLPAFGLNTDRVWVALDQDGTAWSFIACGISAVLAIGLSVTTLLVPREKPVWRSVMLVLGAFFYVTALVGVLFVAGNAGDLPGRPTISEVSLTPAENGAQLELAIAADRVDNDQTVTFIVDVGGREIYRSQVPSDDNGLTKASASLFLAQTEAEADITVKAWVTEKGTPDCKKVHLWGPACATLTR